jgi:hypothetical protein
MAQLAKFRAVAARDIPALFHSQIKQEGSGDPGKRDQNDPVARNFLFHRNAIMPSKGNSGARVTVALYCVHEPT